MDNAQYQWKEYAQSFTVDPKHDLKIFGKVERKNGNIFYRCYHRILKNGKGVSFLDIFAERGKRQKEVMRRVLGEAIFING